MPETVTELMTDDELDVIMLTLEEAGLVETYSRPDGRMACRLTAQGQRVGWMLAMRGDDADVVLSDLLDASAE